MRYVETREALKDKKQILKSYSKSTQSKLEFFVKDILDNPRNQNSIGNPELLKYSEKEIVVFYQYLGHYQDK